MKLAILAGRIVGLPLPVLLWRTELISQSELCALRALEAVLEENGLDTLEDGADDASALAAGLTPAVDRSFRALELLVKGADPTLQDTGLIKMRSPYDGHVEWVSALGKGSFEEYGREALQHAISS